MKERFGDDVQFICYLKDGADSKPVAGHKTLQEAKQWMGYMRDFHGYSVSHIEDLATQDTYNGSQAIIKW